MSIIGIIIFFIGWIYSIGAFGFFLGVGIGWIPTLFVAIILDFIIVFSLGLIGLAIEKRKFSSFQQKLAKSLPEISPAPNSPAATPEPISTVRSKAWRAGAALFAIIMACLFIAAFLASKTAENSYTEATGNYGDNVQVYYGRETTREHNDYAGTATDDLSSEAGQYGNSLSPTPLQDQDFIIEGEGQTPASSAQTNFAIENLSAAARTRALNFVRQHFAAISSDETTALSWLQVHYAPAVAYYNKDLNESEVLNDKKSYIRRWPIRKFTINPYDIYTNCDQNGYICRVTGTVDFECHAPSRAASSSGTSSFAISIDFRERLPAIIEEWGQIQSRR